VDPGGPILCRRDFRSIFGFCCSAIVSDVDSTWHHARMSTRGSHVSKCRCASISDSVRPCLRYEAAHAYAYAHARGGSDTNALDMEESMIDHKGFTIGITSVAIVAALGSARVGLAHSPEQGSLPAKDAGATEWAGKDAAVFELAAKDGGILELAAKDGGVFELAAKDGGAFLTAAKDGGGWLLAAKDGGIK